MRDWVSEVPVLRHLRLPAQQEKELHGQERLPEKDGARWLIISE